MSQFGSISSGGGGGGTVTSVSGGNNITITGVPTINPTVNVSGTTNHSVLVGNATGSLTSIAVGTTGQILTGVTGADPVFVNNPAATSFITSPATGTATPSSGVLTFAGTGGTTVSAAGSTITINSTGGTLPAFFAYSNTTVNNVTGNGTNYNLIYDTVTHDNTGMYNSATGIFTVPTTGFYSICCNILWTGVTAVNTSGALYLYNNTAATYLMTISYAPGTFFNVFNNSAALLSGIFYLTAGDSLFTQTFVGGGAQIVGVFGGGIAGYTTLSCALIR